MNYPTNSQLDVSQLHANDLHKIRIYNTDPSVLKSLANANIEVIVGVKNDEIMEIAKSPMAGEHWVARNILPFVAFTNISAIAVGNEVITSGDEISEGLLQAMRNIYASLVCAKLDERIKVSSPHSVLLLETSFPPSSGSFHESHLSVLRPLLVFLEETKAPLMLNVDLHQAFFTEAVSLEHYLSMMSEGVDDPDTGLHYEIYLDAVLDSVLTAMGALNLSNIPLIVTETGWLSHNELSHTYNMHLQNHILNHPGTPMNPDADIGVYITDFFNSPMHHILLEEYSDIGRPRARKLASQVWCVAKQGLDNATYQAALDWTCGNQTTLGGVNCGPIQLGGLCYTPNNYISHCSWAFNQYFQTHGQTNQSCDFQGAAMMTSTDPSEILTLSSTNVCVLVCTSFT